MKGSVVKKGNKYYVVLYMGKKADGKKDYKWYSGYNTQKEADDGLTELRKAAKDKTLVDNNNMTVDDYFDIWMEDHVKPNLAEGTADRNNSARLQASAMFGRTKIQKLEPYHVQRWVNEMAKLGLSKSTIVTYYNAIKAAFNKAVSWRILSRNPCVEITLPKVKKKTMKTLTATEVTMLLEVTKGHPMQLVILLAASCGMRRGEILGLRWRQVDMDNQTLHLSENYTQSSQGAKLGDLKTESSYRTVNFSDSVKKALKEQRSRQIEALRSSPVIPIESLTEDSLQDLHVCTWYDLRPIRPLYVTKRFKELAKALELPDIRFHDLRHTHATLLLMAGVHPKVVQERLGHSTIAMTLDTYSHILPSMQKEASQLLNF